MVPAIVIDDEWYNLEETSGFVEATHFFHVVGKYQNPVTALEEMNQIDAKVAFIDIELPEMDGITVAEKLLEINPSIIIVFITSYNQYAVKAFDLNAIDYILKPIKKERFNQMVEKIKKEINVRLQKHAQNVCIRCFGAFTVTIGGVVVKWERAKAEELFAYLLVHHDSFVHKDKIIEELWPGYEQEKALKILQTAVCKIRNLFSVIKDIVKLEYSGSKYCLMINGADCDLFYIEQVINMFDIDAPDTYQAIEQACEIYSNGLLTESGYLWSIQNDQQLHDTLKQVLDQILKVYRASDNDWNVVQLLKRMVRITASDEKLNYELMKLYQKRRDYQEVQNHYQWLKTILKQQYDLLPAKEIQEIAESCRSTEVVG
jgi:two-component SAPR family response regulator